MASLGKLNVKYAGLSKEGNLCFEVLQESKYNSRFAITQMLELIAKGKDIFVLTIDKYINSRTRQQNKLMWALLELMAEDINGGRTGDGKGLGVTSWDCYIDMLEDFGSKFQYVMCLPEAVEDFKSEFRAVKFMENRDYNGTEMSVLKCFFGSSKMNTIQMGMLIDGIFDKLSVMGVDDKYKADIDYMYLEWEKRK